MLRIGTAAAIAAIPTTVAAFAALLICQPTPTRAAEVSCNQSAGAAKAAIYVTQCLQVSPATHPPCNASNACALIIAEIRRSCALLGTDAPRFCASYK